MAFNGEGALSGAAGGAAAGSAAGPWGALAGGVIGGVAGGFMGGKKKVKPIDITQQLAALKSGVAQGRLRTDNLYDTLQPLTSQYQTDTTKSIAGARERGVADKAALMTEQSDLATQAKDALRKNLYSTELGALPDTLRAVREASAAGSGVDSGAYQQAVQNVGRDTSRAIVQGETGIQAQGLQSQQDASKLAYQTFSNLSSKLDDQEITMLAGVMDTKRADLVRRTAQQMGLDETETQGVIDLMNFQQSGELASSAADAGGKQDLMNALLSGTGTIAGLYAKKGK